MARFRFEQPRTRPAAPAWVLHSALRTLDAQDAAADESPAGPGWFESSWELEHGLKVSEGLPGDADLHEWLDVALRA